MISSVFHALGSGYAMTSLDSGWTLWQMNDGVAWSRAGMAGCVFQKTGDTQFYAAEAFLSREFAGPFDTLEAAQAAAMLLEK